MGRGAENVYAKARQERLADAAEMVGHTVFGAVAGKELWRRAVLPQAVLLEDRDAAQLTECLQKHAETLGDYCLCGETQVKQGKSGSQPGPFLFFQEQLGGQDARLNAWGERMKKLVSTPLHKQEDLLIVNTVEGHSHYTVSQMEALSLAMLGAGWRAFHSFFEARNSAI